MLKSKFVIFFALFFSFFLPLRAFSEQEQLHDYLYSEEYFDYLIECASQEAQEEKDNEEEQEILLDDNEISMFKFDDEISSDYAPFKLRIEENASVKTYSETFKKEDTKTIIPLSQKFSMIQDTLKFRNKYNSDDYRVLAGAEYRPSKYFDIASGLETNYRGFDQNPTSRKLYFTPTLYITDKLSLSFYNKYNVQNYSSDHDISVNFSPLKSKAVDFKVYAGVTKQQSGVQSESINFYTNFYFF